ncbi:putative uncharacterized protein DDB_G0282133 isoform X2 [Coccinella septempunctata]|uniref:putative uncharacterized protein DDB_G0282133 isoform X2 n=1 Tax=Coccinella septempunctata TaxID=41139 RepID=UPI001D075686|nr:putative uncharacterized protein DDB_G0282133 isoform X2 [Coccinella septempunctata]
MELSRTIETETGEMIVKRVSVPLGLEELMEGLAKEVILKKPKDIYIFAADYFSRLLQLRDSGLYRGNVRSAKLAVRRPFRATVVGHSALSNSETKGSGTMKGRKTPFPQHSDSSNIHEDRKTMIQNHLRKKKEIEMNKKQPSTQPINQNNRRSYLPTRSRSLSKGSFDKSRDSEETDKTDKRTFSSGKENIPQQKRTTNKISPRSRSTSGSSSSSLRELKGKKRMEAIKEKNLNICGTDTLNKINGHPKASSENVETVNESDRDIQRTISVTQDKNGHYEVLYRPAPLPISEVQSNKIQPQQSGDKTVGDENRSSDGLTVADTDEDPKKNSGFENIDNEVKSAIAIQAAWRGRKERQKLKKCSAEGTADIGHSMIEGKKSEMNENANEDETEKSDQSEDQSQSQEALPSGNNTIIESSTNETGEIQNIKSNLDNPIDEHSEDKGGETELDKEPKGSDTNTSVDELLNSSTETEASEEKFSDINEIEKSDKLSIDHIPNNSASIEELENDGEVKTMSRKKSDGNNEDKNADDEDNIGRDYHRSQTIEMTSDKVKRTHSSNDVDSSDKETLRDVTSSAFHEDESACQSEECSLPSNQSLEEGDTKISQKYNSNEAETNEMIRENSELEQPDNEKEKTMNTESGQNVSTEENTLIEPKMLASSSNLTEKDLNRCSENNKIVEDEVTSNENFEIKSPSRGEKISKEIGLEKNIADTPESFNADATKDKMIDTIDQSQDIDHSGVRAKRSTTINSGTSSVGEDSEKQNSVNEAQQKQLNNNKFDSNEPRDNTNCQNREESHKDISNNIDNSDNIKCSNTSNNDKDDENTDGNNKKSNLGEVDEQHFKISKDDCEVGYEERIMNQEDNSDSKNKVEVDNSSLANTSLENINVDSVTADLMKEKAVNGNESHKSDNKISSIEMNNENGEKTDTPNNVPRIDKDSRGGIQNTEKMDEITNEELNDNEADQAEMKSTCDVISHENAETKIDNLAENKKMEDNENGDDEKTNVECDNSVPHNIKNSETIDKEIDEKKLEVDEKARNEHSAKMDNIQKENSPSEKEISKDSIGEENKGSIDESYSTNVATEQINEMQDSENEEKNIVGSDNEKSETNSSSNEKEKQELERIMMNQEHNPQSEMENKMDIESVDKSEDVNATLESKKNCEIKNSETSEDRRSDRVQLESEKNEKPSDDPTSESGNFATKSDILDVSGNPGLSNSMTGKNLKTVDESVTDKDNSTGSSVTSINEDTKTIKELKQQTTNELVGVCLGEHGEKVNDEVLGVSSDTNKEETPSIDRSKRKSALRIQTIWRGFQARKHLKKLLEHKLEESDYRSTPHKKLSDDLMRDENENLPETKNQNLPNSEEQEIIQLSKTAEVENEDPRNIEDTEEPELQNGENFTTDEVRAAIKIQSAFRNSRKKGLVNNVQTVESHANNSQQGRENDKTIAHESDIPKINLRTLNNSPSESKKNFDKENYSGEEIRAAVKIQTAFRKCRENFAKRREENSPKVEHFNETDHEMENPMKSESSTSANVDGFSPDEIRAATKIQSTFRKSRKQRSKPKLEDLDLNSDKGKEYLKEILKIQSAWRAYRVKKNIRDVEKKITTMENISGNHSKKSIHLTDQEILKAVTKIQAGLRGYLTRKHFSNLRGQNESLDRIKEESSSDYSRMNSTSSNDEQLLEILKQVEGASIPNTLPDIPSHEFSELQNDEHNKQGTLKQNEDTKEESETEILDSGSHEDLKNDTDCTNGHKENSIDGKCNVKEEHIDSNGDDDLEVNTNEVNSSEPEHSELKKLDENGEKELISQTNSTDHHENHEENSNIGKCYEKEEHVDSTADNDLKVETNDVDSTKSQYSEQGKFGENGDEECISQPNSTDHHENHEENSNIGKCDEKEEHVDGTADDDLKVKTNDVDSTKSQYSDQEKLEEKGDEECISQPNSHALSIPQPSTENKTIELKDSGESKNNNGTDHTYSFLDSKTESGTQIDEEVKKYTSTKLESTNTQGVPIKGEVSSGSKLVDSKEEEKTGVDLHESSEDSPGEINETDHSHSTVSSAKSDKKDGKSFNELDYSGSLNDKDEKSENSYKNKVCSTRGTLKKTKAIDNLVELAEKFETNHEKLDDNEGSNNASDETSTTNISVAMNDDTKPGEKLASFEIPEDFEIYNPDDNHMSKNSGDEEQKNATKGYDPNRDNIDEAEEADSKSIDELEMKNDTSKIQFDAKENQETFFEPKEEKVDESPDTIDNSTGINEMMSKRICKSTCEDGSNCGSSESTKNVKVDLPSRTETQELDPKSKRPTLTDFMKKTLEMDEHHSTEEQLLKSSPEKVFEDVQSMPEVSGNSTKLVPVRSRYESATKIQSVYRGYKARKYAESLKNKLISTKADDFSRNISPGKSGSSTANVRITHGPPDHINQNSPEESHVGGPQTHDVGVGDDGDGGGLQETVPGVEILTTETHHPTDVDGASGDVESDAQPSVEDANTQDVLSNKSEVESVCEMESTKRNNSTLRIKNMEAEAATKIQAGFRGYKVRKQLKMKGTPSEESTKKTVRRKSSSCLTENQAKKQKENIDLQEKSAVKIQAGIRGFLVRKKVKRPQKSQE